MESRSPASFPITNTHSDCFPACQSTRNCFFVARDHSEKWPTPISSVPRVGVALPDEASRICWEKGGWDPAVSDASITEGNSRRGFIFGGMSLGNKEIQISACSGFSDVSGVLDRQGSAWATSLSETRAETVCSVAWRSACACGWCILLVHVIDCLYNRTLFSAEITLAKVLISSLYLMKAKRTWHSYEPQLGR
jgi:hypothetical protein